MNAEVVAARVLLIGGLLGVALMLVGVVMAAIHGEAGLDQVVPRRAVESIHRGHPADTVVSLGQIAHGLTRRPMDPVAVSALGIVVLFGTPGVAVVGAGVAFFREGDARFTTIAAIVAAALVLSFWLGGV